LFDGGSWRRAGLLGALCRARYVVSVLASPISTHLPFGTLIINVSGSFLVGFFGTLTLAGGRFPISETIRIFVTIGLCGGYTTLSAFNLQTFDLLRSGFALRATVRSTWSGQWSFASPTSPSARSISRRLNGL
jgi:CrcB protein